MTREDFWSLIEQAKGDEAALDPEISNELFGYAALKAYEFAAERELTARTVAHPAEPVGEEWDFDDEVENRRRLPRLAARYLPR